MYDLMFVFNVILVILFSVCSAGFAFCAVRERKALFGYIALMFAFFLIDECLLFFTEYISGVGETIELLPSWVFAIEKGMLVFPYLLIASEYYNCMSKYSVCGMALIFLVNLAAHYQSIIDESLLLRFFVPLVSTIWVAVIGIRGELKLTKISGRHFRMSALLLTVYIVLGLPIPFTLLQGDIDYIYLRSATAEIKSVIFSAAGIQILISRFCYSEKKKKDGLEKILKEYQLSARETELLPLFCENKSYKEISEEKFISVSTVKVHKHNIYRKLGVKNPEELNKVINERRLK